MLSVVLSSPRPLGRPDGSPARLVGRAVGIGSPLGRPERPLGRPLGSPGRPLGKPVGIGRSVGSAFAPSVGSEGRPVGILPPPRPPRRLVGSEGIPVGSLPPPSPPRRLLIADKGSVPVPLS